jgi:hypothetical protein
MICSQLNMIIYHFHKNKTLWGAGCMAQVIDHLPSRCEALGSISSTTNI